MRAVNLRIGHVERVDLVVDPWGHVPHAQQMRAGEQQVSRIHESRRARRHPFKRPLRDLGSRPLHVQDVVIVREELRIFTVPVSPSTAPLTGSKYRVKSRRSRCIRVFMVRSAGSDGVTSSC